MATQHGPVKLTGLLGGISFYKRNGKYYARTKTCHSKTRIQTDPAFAKTYQCSTDFGVASRASKLLRIPLADVIGHVADKAVVSRLTGAFVKLLQGDGVHTAGHRQIADGDLNVLKGFEFNNRTAFHHAFTSPYKISISKDHREATLYVPSWTRADIAPPTGATHARLFAAVIGINPKTDSHTVSTRYTGYLDLNSQRQQSVALVNTIKGKPGDVLVITPGIEFFQQVNGTMEVLMQGGAMVIAEAQKVAPQPVVTDHHREMFLVEQQIRVKNCRFVKSASLVHHDLSPSTSEFLDAWISGFSLWIKCHNLPITLPLHKALYVSLNPNTMVQTPATTSKNKIKKTGKINYVAHLNAWYAYRQRDRRMTSSHISLYMILFFRWNAAWFQNPITVYRDEVMAEAGIGSRNTYAKCLRELADWGYIIYGSESRTRGSTIEMVPLAERELVTQLQDTPN